VSRLDCADLVELAPELAVGNLCGEERAAAIAHLDTCTSCQHVVSSLTAVTDGLLLLAPRAEPPAGFEQRVLGALPAELASRRRRPRLRRRWATAVAAAAMVLSFLAGGPFDDVGSPTDRAFARAEMRTANGDVVGQIVLGDGELFVALPAWAAQIERYGPSGATYELRIESRDGDIRTRPVDLSGDASWTTSLDIDADAVAQVAVVDGDGHVWCSADVPSPTISR
jgi:hypothetical protein